MRIPVLAVMLAAFAGSASAGDPMDARYGSNDYSAQVYYRVDFGGTRDGAQSVGLRFDQENAAAHGAPALFQATYGEQGLGKVALTGVDLRSLAISSQATSGGGLTVAQWVGIGFTAVVFGMIAVEAADSEDAADGTGSY